MGKAFKEMTTKELKEMALSLYDVIYNIECFGTSDLHNYGGALQELENRGYQIQEKTTLVIHGREK